MKFSIRDLMWLMVVSSLVLGWWADHRQLTDELQKERLRQLERLIPGLRPAEIILPNSQAPAEPA